MSDLEDSTNLELSVKLSGKNIFLDRVENIMEKIPKILLLGIFSPHSVFQKLLSKKKS